MRAKVESSGQSSLASHDTGRSSDVAENVFWKIIHVPTQAECERIGGAVIAAWRETGCVHGVTLCAVLREVESQLSQCEAYDREVDSVVIE